MKKLAVIVLAILVSSFFLPPRMDTFVFAEGAILGLSPESGAYAVGKTFTVKVVVSSGGQAINAAEGVVNFDNKLLAVTKVAKDNSIFTLWAVEPSFANSAGTVSFGGGNTSPFDGNNGTVVTITFKVLSAGSAELTFSSGSVLAADGKGTNVLSNFGKGTYTFKEAEAATPPPKATPIPTPIPTPTPTVSALPLPPPEITSATHADTEKWYANNDPEFEWKLAPDITGVSLALTEVADSDPGPALPTLIESQTFKDIPDGEWYFHLKFQDKAGTMAITHRKLRIDTTAPRPFTIDVRREDATDPRPLVYFMASDETSGLDHYEIQVGDGEAVSMNLEDFRKHVLENGLDDTVKPYPYKMPLQAAGNHAVHIKAVDRAGNGTSVVKDVAIEALEPPKITTFFPILREGSVLLLEGTTWPDSTLLIRLQKGEEKPVQEELRPISKTAWQFAKKNMERGEFKVSAKSVDKRGAESAFSEVIAFRVVPPALIERFGWIAVGVLAAAILGLLGMLRWERKTVRANKENLHKEIGEMREHMKNVFDALEEEVDEKIKFLLEKPSMGTADHVQEVLRVDLETSQELIDKEIQDVEKAVK